MKNGKTIKQLVKYTAAALIVIFGVYSMISLINEWSQQDNYALRLGSMYDKYEIASQGLAFAHDSDWSVSENYEGESNHKIYIESSDFRSDATVFDVTQGGIIIMDCFDCLADDTLEYLSNDDLQDSKYQYSKRWNYIQDIHNGGNNQSYRFGNKEIVITDSATNKIEAYIKLEDSRVINASLYYSPDGDNNQPFNLLYELYAIANSLVAYD